MANSGKQGRANQFQAQPADHTQANCDLTVTLRDSVTTAQSASPNHTSQHVCPAQLYHSLQLVCLG